MEIIGITGKSGTGKSTFTEMLAKKYKYCTKVDIDKIGHFSLVDPEIIERLRKNFGDGILDENGNINRKKVGDLVFAERHNMEILKELTWEFMQQKIDKILSGSSKTVILEWILLPHSKYWDMCNTKILVCANEQERRDKIIKRDNISEEYLNKRDSASIDYSSYKFDHIVENHYEDGEIRRAVDDIFREIEK